MKKIDMPSDEVIVTKAHMSGQYDTQSYRNGFREGIAYANDQIEKENDRVARILQEYANHAVQLTINPQRSDADWEYGSALKKFIPELIEKLSPHIEKPWQPEPGQKCAFWNTPYATMTAAGSYSEAPDGCFGPLEDVSNDYDYCAALESLDEIGKPPSYFIERGRCTVAK